MINKMAWSVTNMFIRREEIPEEDGEIYAFGFECMLSTAIQIIVLIIAGLVFNCLIELTIYSLCFTQIKKHIGGWHANTHLTCISGYTILSLISILICRFVPDWASCILLFAALILIFRFAPIQHVNNPKSETEIKQARKTSLLTSSLIVICICAALLSPLSNYAIYGACGLFVASLSLIIPNKANEEQE